MRIVHAADLHLDSPLAGLERYPGAPVEAIRGASRRALANLVGLCLEEHAALLLIAGDVYDGDWRDYSTGMFFASQLQRLRDAGTRVALVRGNHDAASQITRYLDLPSHVTELASAHPVTLRIEELGVAVHGQSFRDRSVQDDLASRYPDPVRGVLNIGLLHTSLTGREGHHDYAPCTVETLRSRGYDYWALGHVHQREVVSEEPWIVFPGNLQGRDAKETGAKGATLLTVEDGCIASVEHRALDVVRWAVCDVDATGAGSADEIVELVRGALDRVVSTSDGRTVAARVVVRGATRAHAALTLHDEKWESQIRLAGRDVAGDELWVEKVQWSTAPIVDRERLAARDDAVGQVVSALGALRTDVEGRAALLEAFTDLRSKLPQEAREGLDAVRLEDPEFFAQALADVESLLLTALGSAEVDA